MIGFTTVGRGARLFFALTFLWAQTTGVIAQTATLLPNGQQQFFSNTGVPLSSGQVYFYIPGTSNAKTVWSDPFQSNPLSNPVALDSAGRATIYGSGVYRQVLFDNLNNQIWDQLTSSTGLSNGGGSGGQGDGLAVGTILPFGGSTLPTNYDYAAGQTYNRSTSSALFTALTVVQTVTCISSNTSLTVSDSTKLRVGEKLEATPCVGSGTTISSITNATTVVLSSGAIGSSTTSATFFPWGNGDGSSTFNLPDLRSQVIAGVPNMGGTDPGTIIQAYCGALPNFALGLGGMCGGASTTLLTANLPASAPIFAGTPVAPTGNFVGTSHAWSFTPDASSGTGNVGTYAPGTITAGNFVATTSTGLLIGTGPTNASNQTVNVVVPSFTPKGTTTVLPAGTLTMNPYTPAGVIANLGSATPISQLQPTTFANYIIKVTADTATTLPTEPADTVMGNFGAAAAQPTGVPMPSCSGTSAALAYNISTHSLFCNAITVGGTLQATLPLQAATVSGITTVSYNAIDGDSIVGNFTGGSAAPTSAVVPSCSSASAALQYDSSAHAIICGSFSGSGTVNAGTTNQLAYYASNGTAVSGLATAASGVLATDGSGVPSIATALPFVVPGATGGTGIANSGKTITVGANLATTGGATTLAFGATGRTYTFADSAFSVAGQNLANTFSATNNFTGALQVNGNAMTFPSTAESLAALTKEDQTLSGGANVTAKSLGTQSSGTLTIDCGARPLQYVVNNGSFILAAPSNDASCMLQMTNGASAVLPTFSGFSEGSNTGDALDTTNGHTFFISIMRINAISHYLVSAAQ